VFRRAKVPITRWPVIPISIDKLWKERVAAPRTWQNAVEKLRSRQTDLKERAAAAKIAGWTKAVEKVRSKQAALAEQAACVLPTALARPVAKIRARQVADLTACERSPASRDRAPSQSRLTTDRIWSLAGRSETETQNVLSNRILKV
jgi:hypothetical protein